MKMDSNHWAAGLVMSALAGCAGPSLPPSGNVPAPASALTTGAPVTASALSYGSVTSQVQKGKTTQLELLQIFGGPSISTTDRDGVETWVYERTSTQSDVQSNAQSAQGAASLGAFFKFVNVDVSGSTGRSSSGTSAATSVRSLTVIVKFAADKTVADYSVRASTF